MSRSTGAADRDAPGSAPQAFRLARERPLLLATVFLTGACVLVVEIAGSRVVAPLYGSGLYSWSALISVTLASLSLGYWVGGRAADRRPDPALFHTGILGAGLLVLAIPWAAGAVLRITEPLEPRLGVLLASALLFFPALAMLGGVTPFAIRLARPPAGEVGAVSGLFFAVSTIGSLLAALATGFVLIPNLGVRSILALTGVALTLTAAAGLVASRRRARAIAAVLAAVATLLAWRGMDPARGRGALRILARIPSFFGYLRVVETDAERMLTVNGIGQNYVPLVPGVEHSEYLEFMGALPRLHRAARPDPSALLIGLGAGELVAKLDAAGVRLTVVEIDPKVEETARRFFGLELPHERIHIADGRTFLERDAAVYDFVLMDAFLGEDVPGHLYTREAFRAMRRRLAPGGLVAINYTSIPNGRDVRSMARTLQAEFPHVVGFTDVSDTGELASNVFLASASPFALDPVAAAAVPSAGLFLAHELRAPEAGGTLLTDDYNPINVYRLGVNRRWRQDMIRHIGEDWAYWADF
ncbi:MAG: fused MFS/spermidine synthase [Candidatus Eiseniibacteriota bacterium]